MQDGRAPAATGVDVGLGQASARVPSSASALHASTLPAELGGVDLPQVCNTCRCPSEAIIQGACIT